MALAEDVYYVTRDGQDVIGLNQLLELPAALGQVELEAIETMAQRSVTTMGRRRSALPCEPVGADAVPRTPGLYYVGPDSDVWVISDQDRRPDLDGTAMDFAVGTVKAGLENLRELRYPYPSSKNTGG